MFARKDHHNLLKKMRENTLAIERMKEDTKRLFGDLGITAEQIEAYLSDESNFSKEVWQELQLHRQLLDDQLKDEIEQISDPKQSQKSFLERGQVQQHWLFVR